MESLFIALNKLLLSLFGYFQATVELGTRRKHWDVQLNVSVNSHIMRDMLKYK